MNGKEVFPSNAKYFDVHAPATGLKLTSVVAYDKALVTEAIEIAHKTHESGVWARADVRDRAKVLNNMAENLRSNIPRLADMEVAQTGRAVREMKAQVRKLIVNATDSDFCFVISVGKTSRVV